MTSFEDFLAASRLLGSQPDLVQGGGGNTSYKLDDKLMAIKASGFLLSEMDQGQAYTTVNYPPVIDYYNQHIDTEPTKTQEDAGSAFVASQIDNSGLHPQLRPSMETGFHAVLEKVVYHTHSVYANLVNCAEGSEMLLKTIFKDTAFRPVFIEYANPGFGLSQSILQAKIRFVAEYGSAPEVYFLENHGLITTGEDIAVVLEVDKRVNSILKNYFNINNDYQAPSIQEIEAKTFESQNGTLAQWVRDVHPADGYFEQVLFPDQVVFFSGHVHIGANISTKKININPYTGKVIYKVNTMKEAVTLEETLQAYLFIRINIDRAGLQPKFIGGTQADYINNMESEAYRRSLLKNHSS